MFDLRRTFSPSTVIHLVNLSLFLIVLGITTTPILAGVSYLNAEWALANAIFITVSLLLPFLHVIVSFTMEGSKNHGNSCFIVPYATMVRVFAASFLHLALVGLAWTYYRSPLEIYYPVILTLSITLSVINLIGVTLMFGFLYARFIVDNSPKEGYASI